MGKSLAFGLSDRVAVCGKVYIVRGIIKFQDTKELTCWNEYKLEDSRTGTVKWLSIDEANQEYALYTQHPYSKEFSQSNIHLAQFHLSDSGVAKVCGYQGGVDVRMGDQVNFTEYEDKAEERLIAIEKWSDEAEYSKGVYLDAAEIEKGGTGKLSNDPKRQKYQTKEWDYSKLIIWGIVIFVFVGLLHSEGAFDELGFAMFKQHALRDYLAKSSDFTYQTSITADLDPKQKADVYGTSLTVEAATKKLLDAIEGLSEDVQEDQGDSTVGLLTKHEYCLIYQDWDNQTMVQVSARRYAYSSRHSPYHSNHSVARYYRRYYYYRAFQADQSKYHGPNGYGNYRENDLGVNSDDSYRLYSGSVRQASLDARSSSDEDSNFGK